MLQTTPKSLVIVDDDPIFREYLTTLLQSEAGIFAHTAGSGDELFEILEKDEVDCIVLDYDLGTETGLSVGQRVKERFADAPPIIMLTGQGSERTATKAFRIGFADYVSKRNMVTSELVAAIRSAEARRAEEKAQAETLAKLRRNAHFDGLTGLHAVDYVQRRLAELCSGKVTDDFALVVLTLDTASLIRREFGHAMADRVIETFGKQLMQATRGSALCGHIGTDSFVCAYEGEGADAAALAACERFSSALSVEVQVETTRVRAAPAIGAARFPQDGPDPQALIDAAMEALKLAAADGKAYGSTFDVSREETAPRPAPGATGIAANAAVAQEAEKRREPRRRVLKQGRIIIDGLSASIDCSVRNTSRSGALLRVESFFAVPNNFKLMIVGETQPLEVQKRWQNGLDLGVEYQRSTA